MKRYEKMTFLKALGWEPEASAWSPMSSHVIRRTLKRLIMKIIDSVSRGKGSEVSPKKGIWGLTSMMLFLIFQQPLLDCRDASDHTETNSRVVHAGG